MRQLVSELAKRGKLTLFLGAAAGVGKTYAMLTAAEKQREQGIDVLLGWMEAAAYPDTKSLNAKLQFPVLSKKNGLMDTEGIIQKRPGLVLVDNLEPVNGPNAMRPKRYLDVETILGHGIDVYATLNIQHVESLNDIVSRIIGWNVVETVPDTFLEQADRIQLVDAPTDEIIQRFNRAGLNESEREAQRKFYRAGNIDALREMAFRYAAQRVDSQLEQYMQAKKISGPWPVAEKVMVCVSASPFSKQLIRMGRQMAAGLKSDWIAVYVQTPQGFSKDKEKQDQLSRNLQLAEELGAEVVTISGNHIAEELLSLARSRNVKQMIIGKPLRSRIGEWLRSSVVEQIIRNSHGINVHVIPASLKSDQEPRAPLRGYRSFSLKSYAWITVSIALLTVILHPFGLTFELVNIALLYLIPVLLSAVYGGIGPSFYAAALGVLAFDFFFVPPFLSFTVADLRYLVSFVVFLAVAALTGSLAARLKEQLRFSKQREAHTASLYALSRQMSAITDIHSLLENVSRQVSQMAGTPVAIYLPDDKNELRLSASSFVHSQLGQSDSEMVIAKWVYQHGEIAGKGSNTLRESSGLYVPLRTEDRIYGVLSVNLESSHAVLSPDTVRLLEALCGLAASAIARVKLAEEAKLAHLMAESEKLRTALLDSVSHELRTPLATIIGSVTGLIEGDRLFSPEDRLDLLATIRDGALRMNRLVTNLLGMVKLESDMLHLRKKWCDVEDIIGVVLAQVKDFQQHRNIRVELPDHIPMILGDEVLLEQVLVNVISNAIKFSPDYSNIDVSVKTEESSVVIAVADAGIGLAAADRERIFDKFYRAEATRHVPGTGLGLAICKGIVELHGGLITAQPNVDRGTKVMISLPLNEESKPSPLPPEGETEQP
ncbi:sensor histidine kinase [Gordoniibacillus kamchatkensis]|uniref:sensor histidine kinase n=1 Tax=Gordoniibacillus kamchatkensis TaxID=1590651 RepID=UPI001E36EDED|nr:sensor histidine kinase KdpD [Paenibacillus sp. VKM B-2647]